MIEKFHALFIRLTRTHSVVYHTSFANWQPIMNERCSNSVSMVKTLERQSHLLDVNCEMYCNYVMCYLLSINVINKGRVI